MWGGVRGRAFVSVGLIPSLGRMARNAATCSKKNNRGRERDDLPELQRERGLHHPYLFRIEIKGGSKDPIKNMMQLIFSTDGGHVSQSSRSQKKRQRITDGRCARSTKRKSK